MSDALARRAAPIAWWRHPGSALVLHVHRAVVGALAALPVAAAVARLLGGRSGVDATLLDDGGRLLPDVIQGLRAAPPGPAGPLVLIVGSLVGLATTAGVLHALAHPGRRPLTERIGLAVGIVPVIALASLLGVVVRVALAWLVAGAGLGIVDRLELEEPTRDLATLGVLAAALLAASLVSLGLDLFAAGIAGLRLGLVDAVAAARSALVRRGVRLAAARLARAVTGLALLASATLIAIRIGMRGAADAALALVVLEAALLASTCLRLSWLALAVEAVQEVAVGSALHDDAVSVTKAPLDADEAESVPR